MKSRYEQLQDPQSRFQFALFRSSAAVALVVALMAGAALLPRVPTTGASVSTDFNDASVPVVVANPANDRPAHIFESAGTDDQNPHQYMGQPAVY